MSSSNSSLEDFVRVAAQVRGLAIDEAWVAAVAMHLQRLLEASTVVGESELNSNEPAWRFEP
jgi:Protein of unknown function (DUF4089)